MTFPDRPADGGFRVWLLRCWRASAVSRGFSIVLIVLAALAVAAQTPQRPQAARPVQLAARAFLEGRYDEVDQLADKLDARDPDVAALKARAAIARGRYEQAEGALKPVAARLPASEAALELGLLQQL